MIALDPATRYTGYAVFAINGKASLVRGGVIKASANEDWDVRCWEVNSALRNLIHVFSQSGTVDRLVMEYPQFQAGTRGVQAVRGGDTLKLAYLCGSLSCGWQLHMAEQMKRFGHVNVHRQILVVPSLWKGQLPKAVTEKRCFEQFGIAQKQVVDNNMVDAIMLGAWFIQRQDLGLIQRDPGFRKCHLRWGTSSIEVEEVPD